MKNIRVKRIFLIVILVIFTILFMNIPFVSASGSEEGGSSINIDDAMQKADDFVGLGSSFQLSGVKDASDAIYSILLAIGGVVALCVGVFLGVKFMTSTVDEKAKVKESLIVYIIGCIVIFGAFGIWKLVIDMGNSL